VINPLKMFIWAKGLAPVCVITSFSLYQVANLFVPLSGTESQELGSVTRIDPQL